MVEAGGLDASNFSNNNLATKAILLGEGPGCKDPDWVGRSRNTPASLGLLANIWTSEKLSRKDGSLRKRDVKDVPELAEYSAFGQWLLEKVDTETLNFKLNTTQTQLKKWGDNTKKIK